MRRRRACRRCGRRYTTYERIESVTLWVVKRSGEREPFEQEKVVRGVRSASKNRPVPEDEMRRLAADVEAVLVASGSEVTSQIVGMEVLDRLRSLDPVAYLRFASVYKEFADLEDFHREAGLLLKVTTPKRHGQATGAMA